MFRTYRLSAGSVLAIACCVLILLPLGAGYGRHEGGQYSDKPEESDLAPNRDPSRTIRLSLQVDKPVARPGEEVVLTAQADTDCYLTVLNIGSTGRVVRIWPNALSGWNNRIRGNTPTRLSGSDVGFKIVLDGSQPVERIVAYATTEKDAVFEEGDFRGAPGASVKAFSGDERELIERFRERVRDLPRSVKWGTAATTVILAGGERPSGQAGATRVILEMRVPRDLDSKMVMKTASNLVVKGFDLDQEYEPIPMEPETKELEAKLAESSQEIVLVRGTVDQRRLEELEKQPGVVHVWRDDPVYPRTGSCPAQFDSCDCDPTKARGKLADVVKYLGVDEILAKGFRGEGIVVGVVDGGILAEGRDQSGKPTTPRVIGGFPKDWGTKDTWSGHGNMCATDVLGMAPEAHILDIRVGGGRNLASEAIKAYEWATKLHRRKGIPHILSNSWGAFTPEDTRSYAVNGKHPAIRKIRQALKQGIIVLFAAGNCGQCGTDGRCKTYFGPGKTIYFPEAIPQIITVGASNAEGQLVGYSSPGPSYVLQGRKPDFCSITHFEGWFGCDSGTSAACPIAAGVVALLKQVSPELKQKDLQKLLMETAKDIGPPGWDNFSGAGIINAKAAFERLMEP